jgi:hypothetical protein
VHRANLLEQRGVFNGSRGGLVAAFYPCVVAAQADLEDSSQDLDLESSGVLKDKGEDHELSLAKNFVANFKISRS